MLVSRGYVDFTNFLRLEDYSVLLLIFSFSFWYKQLKGFLLIYFGVKMNIVLEGAYLC